MKNEALYNELKSEIEELDRAHDLAVAERPEATGNQAQIYSQIGANTAEEATYIRRRGYLVSQINIAEGPSADVAEYLAGPKKVASKFDLDAGTDKIDDSRTPWGGKRI